MGIISSDEAKTLLAPVEALLYEAVRRAIERWVKDAAPAFATPTKRTRASAVHDFILEEIALFFAGRPGFTMVEMGGRKLLRIHPRIAGRPVLVQFKKLKDGVPRNYRTQLAIQFDRQTVILFGLEDARLTVGYMLNAAGTEATSIRALCMNGNRPAWSFELNAAVSSAATVFAFPAAATKAGGGKRRLRPKDDAKGGGKVVPLRKPGGDGEGQK